MDGTDPNYGVLLWATNETQYTDKDEKWAYSSEYTGDTSLRPKMIITYTVNDPAPDLAAGEFAYDEYGRLVKQVYWNGVSEIRTYDTNRGWLKSKNYANGGTSVYGWRGASYDAVGNLLSVNDDDNAYTYTYDNLNQLKSATGPMAESYNYDENGNITDLGSATFTMSGNRITSSSLGTFGYDQNGNITTHKGTAVTYDWRNMMTGYGSNTYRYDAYGERVKKTESGTTRYYVTSGPQVLAEYNSSGTLVMEHIYANGGRITTIIPGDDTYYTVGDQIQSNRTMVDENGNSDQTADFTPYGGTHYRSGALSEYLFSGKERGSTGLYYFSARYYDPSSGRWLTPDPAGQLLNPYVYAGNNPLVYVDPDGEWFWLALAAFLGGRQGYLIGKAQGQSGFDLAFSTLFGASIGFASAGIVSGIEETVTGAVGLETFSGGLATFAGGFASYGVGAAMSGLGMGVLAGSEGRTLWRQTYQSGLSAGGTAGIINWGLYKVSPKFQWSVHKTVLEYAEKQYGMTGRQFYRFQAVNYVAKMQGLPVDRIVYNRSLWSIDNNYVYGAVEPPFYDLGQIGPFSFLGDNGGFDAGHLWATVYHEGQHVLMSRGAEFLSQSHQIINQAISLQEVQIRGLLLQHKYYKYWSDYAHKEIFRGLLDYR